MPSPSPHPVPSHTSPTLTADSHSSSTASSVPITASTTSIATSHTSHSDSTPFPPPGSEKNQAVSTARSFGAGWKSSSTPTHSVQYDLQESQHDSFLPEAQADADADGASPSALDALLPLRGPPPGRARSPSLPVLPSHALRPSHFRHNNMYHPPPLPLSASPTHYLPDYELYGLSNANTLPTSPFDALPYAAFRSPSSHSALHHHPSLSSLDMEIEDNYTAAQVLADAQLHTLGHGHGLELSKQPRCLSYQDRSSLLHRQSTPNLQGAQRPPLATRGSMHSVRFKVDETAEMAVKQGEETEGAAYGGGHWRAPGLGHGKAPSMGTGGSWGGARGHMASSASMPVLPIVGQGRNVFIHRVNTTLTEDELRQIASSFGEVVSVKIPTHTAKPHAFVMFKKPEQAQKFIAHLKQCDVDCEYGKEDYQVQNKALEDPNSANMYITGLPPTITYDELADLLLPGKICSWKPLVDEAGNRRGPVMARLQTRAQADAVIKKLSGKYYHGMSERLQARIADSDEQKHFKRQQMRERIPLAMGFGQARRRASMPADEMGHDIDDLPVLLQKQSLLATQLSAINEKLARTSLGPADSSPPTPALRLRSVPFPSRPSTIPINNPAFAADVHCPVISQTSTSWRHRHLSSNVSLSHGLIWGSPVRHNAEPWTIDIGSAGSPFMPAMLRRGSISAGVGPRNDGFGGGYDQMEECWQGHADLRSGSNGQKRDGVGARGGGGGGLHHVKSSPELGLGKDGWSSREAMEG